MMANNQVSTINLAKIRSKFISTPHLYLRILLELRMSMDFLEDKIFFGYWTMIERVGE